MGNWKINFSFNSLGYDKQIIRTYNNNNIILCIQFLISSWVSFEFSSPNNCKRIPFISNLPLSTAFVSHIIIAYWIHIYIGPLAAVFMHHYIISHNKGAKTFFCSGNYPRNDWKSSIEVMCMAAKEQHVGYQLEIEGLEAYIITRDWDGLTIEVAESWNKFWNWILYAFSIFYSQYQNCCMMNKARIRGILSFSIEKYFRVWSRDGTRHRRRRFVNSQNIIYLFTMG